ncbi:MAG: ABC transporter ATP-binding protein [Acidimicrobiales bacterium]
MRPPSLLSVERVSAGYGEMLVLRDVSIQVGEGEIACVLGINGAGKSTLLKTIVGGLPARGGSVRLGETDITNWPADRLARSGVGYVPQYGDVFDTLTVTENLEMGGYLLPSGQVASRIRSIFEVFPVLGRMPGRVAGKLSGGERKMVGVARALMMDPKVLVLDEPTAGLSDVLARHLLDEDVRRLSAQGRSVLLVEQRAEAALAMSDWAYVMSAGTVGRSASAQDLKAEGNVGALLIGGAK